MEIESEELCEGLEAKVHSQETKNLGMNECGLTEKIPDSMETKADETESKKSDNNSIDSVHSFKKPNLLIGPRRGKPGQVRTANEATTGALSEASNIDEEKSVNEDSTESVESLKVAVYEKQQLPLPYKEPLWGGQPLNDYKIEVLKSGVILETIDISEKSFYIIGRLPTCDVSLAHPTISRYHAILQYRESSDAKNPRGFYLYDLGSTHGTFWNGCRIRPNTYVRLLGGHMIRFGCSQRKLIMQTPLEETEEESELSVTELKEQRRLLLLEREQVAREEEKRAEEAERLRILKEEEEGIDWGMGEDADEESDLTENPYASTNNEELFLDDPKKTLRGWFEREGHELQYQTEEKGIGQFLCWVDIPIDGAGARTVRAEALVKGKKKESVIQCALEACRILDRHGVLRQATHKARKRATRNWEEEDFYDSDEDNFLDRTGTVEKKREQRMRQAGKLEEKVETYASLLEKHVSVTKKITDIESKLRKSQKSKGGDMETSNEDALDAFMSSLNSTAFNKADVTKMKLELQSLRKEEERLLKLVNITKPAKLPSLTCEKNSDDVPEHANIEQKPIASKKRSSDYENTVIKKIALDTKKNTAESEFEVIDSTTKVSTKEKPTVVNSSETDHSTKEQSDIQNSSEPVTNFEDSEKNENETLKKKKRNLKRMQQRAEKAAKETQKSYEEVEYSEDYSMWLPPENQSGDGKTTLNDKYGY